MTELVSMPIKIIPYLRNTIKQTSGSKEADFAVYQLGRQWGKETARVSGQKCDMDDLTKSTILTAVHSGITNIEMDIGDDIRVKPYDQKVEDDYFIAGYLSGVVTEFLDTQYIPKMEDGEFILVEADEKIEEELFKGIDKESKKAISLGNLEEGESYLIIDDAKMSPITFNIFFDTLDKGVPGLCFTRVFPPKIEEKFRDSNFPIFWLSTIDSAEDINTIKAENFQDRMLKIIEAFLKARGGVIMLHGIEFLLTHNEFEDIIGFLQKVSDITSVNKGVFLLSSDPKALDEKDFSRLKSNLNMYSI
ncbi:MAG: DUF835 domain-containing protein [Thermoplasmata archaeon]